jgi:hypothetical protein
MKLVTADPNDDTKSSFLLQLWRRKHADRSQQFVHRRVGQERGWVFAETWQRVEVQERHISGG